MRVVINSLTDQGNLIIINKTKDQNKGLVQEKTIKKKEVMIVASIRVHQNTEHKNLVNTFNDFLV